MNKVQQKIKQNIVQPALTNQAGPSVGIIRTFDSISQTGTVAITSILDQDEHLIPNVPLMNFGGIKQADPFPGDQVNIIYMDSHYKNPVMLGKIDPMHPLNTRNLYQSHFRAGGSASDIYSLRDGEDWNDKGLV